jgi:RimJ/RimL family protein N-acetyltransferase
MGAIIRPATRADIDALISEELPYRVRAWAVEDDGKLLGVGGFAFQPQDTIAAFVLKSPGAENYPLALHRAGLMAMREAARLGYRKIVALAQEHNEAAERWLERLGFKPVTVDNVTAWVWTE